MSRVLASAARCPYCSAKLPKAPTREHPCPSCKNIFYIQRGQDGSLYAITKSELESHQKATPEIKRSANEDDEREYGGKKMSGWGKALFVFGVIFIIFGFVQWHDGTDMMVITPVERNIFEPYNWETMSDNWDRYLEIDERVKEGESKQTGGGWLIGLGVFFIICGGMTLIGSSKNRKGDSSNPL